VPGLFHTLKIGSLVSKFFRILSHGSPRVKI
jgi:hypothetical protein